MSERRRLADHCYICGDKDCDGTCPAPVSGSSVPEAARAAAMQAAESAWQEHFLADGLSTRREALAVALEAATPTIVAAAVAEERATTGRRIEAAARKHIVQLEAERPPCDEGCQDYPEETCSRHGRKVREVWEMCAALNTRIEAALALCDEADRAAIPGMPGVWVNANRVRAALASPGEES